MPVKAVFRYSVCNVRGKAHYRLLGGDERNRTADPLLAKQVLSRLSYIPHAHCGRGPVPETQPEIDADTRNEMVGLPGIEPGTSRLSSVRSDQLS